MAMARQGKDRQAMQAFRDILVAVVGLTPQVITETLYFLTQVRQPPASLAEIHVLTTRAGKEQVLTHLLAPSRGRFHTFCEEYGLDPPDFEKPSDG